LNLAAAAAVIAQGMAHVATIAAQSFAGGKAHSGLEYVPAEGTYLLQRGERVIQPEQNRELTEFLRGTGGAGDTNIVIERMDILPNATNLQAMLDMSKSDWRAIVEDKIFPAWRTLEKRGIEP
jgi:hypothetical protein